MHHISSHAIRRRAENELSRDGVLSLDVVAHLIDAGVNVETYEQYLLNTFVKDSSTDGKGHH